MAPAGFGQGGSTVDVRGADDVRYRLIQRNGFEAGPLAGWRFSRDEDDDARLAGLGDIDGGLVVGAYGGYRAGPWFFSASYHHQVTGDDDTGGLIRLAIDHTWRPAPHWQLVTSIGTAYASSDYMQTYFGVSAAQAATSLGGSAPIRRLRRLQGCQHRRHREHRPRSTLDALSDGDAIRA